MQAPHQMTRQETQCLILGRERKPGLLTFGARDQLCLWDRNQFASAGGARGGQDHCRTRRIGCPWHSDFIRVQARHARRGIRCRAPQKRLTGTIKEDQRVRELGGEYPSGARCPVLGQPAGRGSPRPDRPASRTLCARIGPPEESQPAGRRDIPPGVRLPWPDRHRSTHPHPPDHRSAQRRHPGLHGISPGQEDLLGPKWRLSRRGPVWPSHPAMYLARPAAPEPAPTGPGQDRCASLDATAPEWGC